MHKDSWKTSKDPVRIDEDHKVILDNRIIELEKDPSNVLEWQKVKEELLGPIF